MYYIQNCSYLLTDSHHGGCFAIIYRKPYAVIANANRGVDRFETVADAFGLRDHLFFDAGDICNSERAYTPIDYAYVAEQIKRENDRAMLWLKNALECPTEAADDTIHTVKADSSRKIAGLSNRIDALESQCKTLNEHYEQLITTNTIHAKIGDCPKQSLLRRGARAIKRKVVHMK